MRVGHCQTSIMKNPHRESGGGFLLPTLMFSDLLYVGHGRTASLAYFGTFGPERALALACPATQGCCDLDTFGTLVDWEFVPGRGGLGG